ncbi:CHAD domain-containing protein [Gluconacetobacter azotocaptans]|uniref:CHAD domain-containing protein n=1 Tax=Gluconacetobacter azotocaptans TaxID=142834 RepID=A0A7W4JQ18_9PROT|nr:CHAD domain-containing protein [Gluconacetobacter azotocaptans]MBB2188692.1 CHAD domain-containing protein [Gluconacetobacter azotocaptans]MBM9400448.1 CHAD domain-containing protein [Gluconacetobacter azotocaptans]GBQ35061.1 CHAD domain containing protein [Gluconacetobacter azotocaptans DSM 13594]
MPDIVLPAIPDSLKAGPIVLGHGDTIRTAACTIIAAIHAHLAANLDAAIDGRNPEGVHQVRVALRRFRALAGLLRRDSLNVVLDGASGHARTLAHALNDARNWDVFTITTLPGLGALAHVEVDAPGVLGPLSVPLRQGAGDAARTALTGAEARRFLYLLEQMIDGAVWIAPLPAAVQQTLDEPAVDFAARHLTRLHRKAHRQGRDLALLAPEERHQLRLTLKKLRYTSEFFQSLHAPGTGAAPYIRRLSRLQDVLGMDSDVLTTRALLARIGEAAPGPDIQHTLGAVAGFLCCRQAATQDRTYARWRKFRRQPVFWRV